MNWDDLRFFIAVANANNITDAGQALKVSASTVSRKILVLEQALNTLLFMKTTQGYFLTEAGHALLPMALEAEERFKLMMRHMAQPGARMAGVVRIDCPELMGSHLIIPALAQFRVQYPQISFDFVNAARSVKLTQSHSDLLLRLQRPEAGNFTLRRVGELTQALFCSPGYASVHGGPEKPADLGQHSLIGWNQALEHLPLARWLDQLSGGQPLWMRTGNLEAQLKAVQAGLGIAALPAYIAEPLGLLRVLPKTPVHRADIWLLRNQATQGQERVDRVVAFLCELLARHGLQGG
ncbi:LysR family transcriptional regulator [Pseudomonas protegens]|uniref:LysR family transcriptional regulator n=1 Tax=Pseudomonas protegens TaxID=380021 RepID=A0A7G7XDS3_9PSED|nr:MULTISPECIES: LysR family transcriptional regulator [Pseudomonas]MDF2399059.1 LysR family transcriptional regulator [Pseudomonas sp. 3MA1]QNH78118.1 LysR family transcriptional regulator [Pseudomonas protegens]QNL07314.1 LysR family transcriptional regulator [Pseudomonas protegens]